MRIFRQKHAAQREEMRAEILSARALIAAALEPEPQ